jgi:hypothetical protein
MRIHRVTETMHALGRAEPDSSVVFRDAGVVIDALLSDDPVGGGGHPQPEELR